jgi:hypothetical protein
MPLLGPPRKKLRNALLSGFQNYESLNRFSKEVLNYDLNRISAPIAGLDHSVEALMTVMDEQGQVDRLVTAARAERPHNPELREVEQDLKLTFLPFADIENLPFSIKEKIRRAGADGSPERVIVESAGFPSAEAFISRLGVAEFRVCFISYALDGGKNVYGTGFLIADDLIITNQHVINRAGPPGSPFTLSGDRITVTFGYRNIHAATQSYTLTERDWLVTSDPKKRADQTEGLDYAVLRLKKFAGKDSIGATSESAARGHFSPVTYTPAVDEPILILQHPYDQIEGKPSPMRLTIGFVTEVIGSDIRHTANTSEGSSGSPVFNSRMELIGLHYWGDVGFNTATKISDIKANLRARGYDMVMSS